MKAFDPKTLTPEQINLIANLALAGAISYLTYLSAHAYLRKEGKVDDTPAPEQDKEKKEKEKKSLAEWSRDWVDWAFTPHLPSLPPGAYK